MGKRTRRYWVPALLVAALAVAGYSFRWFTEEGYRQIAHTVLTDDSESAFRRFLAILPRHGDYFVFEGDILYTEAEVRAEIRLRRETLAALAQEGLLRADEGGAPLDRASKQRLTVRRRLENGPLDVWPRNERRLTYAIDRSSFRGRPKELELVRDGMRKAAREWKDLCESCGFEFTEVDYSEGGEPKPGFATFIVKRDRGDYFAFAFYRSWEIERRRLLLAPAFFADEVDHVGTLRHEFGHILGYVHENYRSTTAPIGICKDDWELPGYYKAITHYDDSSVMHLVCGGDEADSFAISEEDARGHRVLYEERQND